MINPNKICYIFDVDGTLSEPRQKVKQNHKELLLTGQKISSVLFQLVLTL